MADIRLGNLLWKNNTQPISVSNPVNTKDVNSDSIEAELTAVKNELKLVKAELQTIKANQLSGDQKVQLSGTLTELEQAIELLDAISGKDFATQTTLAAVLAKLADLESELATIKANQLSGDQKVQLSGTIAEHKNKGSSPFLMVHGVDRQRSDREFYPFPVDNLKKVVVYIDNRRGLHPLLDVSVALYLTKNATLGSNYYERKLYSTIPAGGELLISSDDEIFQNACVGIGVRLYSYSATDPSEVDYDIFIMGAV